MVIAWLVLLVAVVGLLMYALSANPKLARVGEILFFCGSLVTLFMLAGRTVRLG